MTQAARAAAAMSRLAAGVPASYLALDRAAPKNEILGSALRDGKCHAAAACRMATMQLSAKSARAAWASADPEAEQSYVFSAIMD